MKYIGQILISLGLGALAYPFSVLFAWLYMPRIARLGTYSGLGYAVWTGFASVAIGVAVAIAACAGIRHTFSVGTRTSLRFSAWAFGVLHALNLAFVWLAALFGDHSGQTL
jgi:hypothetical protein